MTAVTTLRPVPGEPARAPTDAQLLASYAETGDPRLREALVERFLPLARSIAKRYRKAEEPFDDLLQVASLGLLKADRPLRPRARHRVLQLRRADDRRRAAPPLPRPLLVGPPAARAAGARAGGRQVPHRADHAPRPLAVGPRDRPGAGARRRAGPRGAAGPAGHARRSLDAPRGGGEDNDATLADAHGVDDPELARAEHRATLARLFERLDEREQRVLRLRFEEDLTQEQIGKLVGVSQMQVSRIIRGAVAKLVRRARRRRLDARVVRPRRIWSAA